MLNSPRPSNLKQAFNIYVFHAGSKSQKILYFLDQKNLRKKFGMVKLTPDLVLGAAQYLNPCRDRELDLRGEL